MAFSFRIYLVLALIICWITCDMIKVVSTSKVLERDPTKKFIGFQIFYGNESKFSFKGSSTSEYNFNCLSKNSRFVVGREFNIDSQQQMSLNVRLYPEKFEAIKPDEKNGYLFEESFDSITNDEYCFLWGSWLPSDQRKQIDFYVTFLTDKDFNRYNELLHLKIEAINGHLKIEYMVDQLGSIKVLKSRELSGWKYNHHLDRIEFDLNKKSPAQQVSIQKAATQHAPVNKNPSQQGPVKKAPVNQVSEKETPFFVQFIKDRFDVKSNGVFAMVFPIEEEDEKVIEVFEKDILNFNEKLSKNPNSNQKKKRIETRNWVELSRTEEGIYVKRIPKIEEIDNIILV